MDFDTNEDYIPPPVHINSIPIPDDQYVKLAQVVYDPSIDTKILQSETNRHIFAEEFTNILSLEDACLREIGKSYKGGPLPMFISENTLLTERFYELLSVEVPLEICIHFDVYDARKFWKKVYLTKCKNQLDVYQKNHELFVDWKKHAVTLKFTEIIQDSLPEEWMIEVKNELAINCKDFITDLQIKQLQSRSDNSFLPHIELTESEIELDLIDDDDIHEEVDFVERKKEIEKKRNYNYPVEDCHHIDLTVLGFLENLTSLSIEYNPQPLAFNYHIRHFRFSYVDIENLAEAIKQLYHLKIFRLCRSLMDCKKFAIILRALEGLEVEELNFSFCTLTDDCGDPLYQFLCNVRSLRILELEKNYFEKHAVKNLCLGIMAYKGNLEYLGLGGNPITTKGLGYITKALLNSGQVSRLSLKAIDVDNDGVFWIIENLLKNHSPLLSLNLNSTKIGCFPAVANFVSIMENNQKIEDLDCVGCELSYDDEFNINLLVKRNKFIHENPYIGNEKLTKEEIEVFVNEVKNPILLKTLDRLKKMQECAQRRLERYSLAESESGESLDIPATAIAVTPHAAARISLQIAAESDSESSKEPFNFDPNDFNEDEIFRHVQVYMPSNRKFFSR